MTAALSFWAGLAVGVLSTVAGSAGVIVWLIRQAPHIEVDTTGMDWSHLRRLGDRTVIHVGEEDPPDPLPLPASCIFCGGPAPCPHDPEHEARRRLGLALRDEDVEDSPIHPERFTAGLPTRGPVTDYTPGVVHHELTPETSPDGVTIYRRTQ